MIASLEVGGLPFNLAHTEKPHYNPDTVIPSDPKLGLSVLPVEMDDEVEELYIELGH